MYIFIYVNIQTYKHIYVYICIEFSLIICDAEKSF